MEIKCGIIKDLLPLYIEGDCSQDTKELIDLHLAECPSCQETLRNMRSPLLAPDCLENAEKRPKKKAFNARRAFLKIKQRWIASLIAVVLIIPLLYLGVNQVRGTGLSFTVIPDTLKVNAMLSAIEKEDYTKAYTYLGIDAIYHDYSTLIETEYIPKEYERITVEGVHYYASKQVVQNEYSQYLEDADAMQFWLSIILSEEAIPFTPIPQFAMESIQQDEELLKALSDAEIERLLYTRSLAETEYGLYYVFDDLTLLNAPYCGALILPEQLYLDYLEELETNRKAAQAYADQYKNMGFEAYNDACFENFCGNLENLRENGVTFVDHRFIDADESSLTYVLYAKTADEGTLSFTVEFLLRDGAVFSSTTYHTQDTPDIVEDLKISPIKLFYIPYED